MVGKNCTGMQEEYKKRHDNIWPEMKEVLAKAGIENYSIWMQGEELFGYYECEKGVDYAAKVQAGERRSENGDEYERYSNHGEGSCHRSTATFNTGIQFQIKEAGYLMEKYYLAVDIGASSGRHILGHLENGKIKLEEIYRFENGMDHKDGKASVGM